MQFASDFQASFRAGTVSIGEGSSLQRARATLTTITMINLKPMEVWFVTGSQHLYGPETLKRVAANSQEIAEALNAASAVPVRVVFKPVLKTSSEVFALCQEA